MLSSIAEGGQYRGIKVLSSANATARSIYEAAAASKPPAIDPGWGRSGLYKRYLPRPSLFRMLARLSALLFSVPEIDLIAMETNRRQ